jgi:SAM-dependent methyltransferase
MDVPGEDPALMREDLYNLRRINRWFGGWHVADRLFEALFRQPVRGRRVLLDVCTGSADLPRRALDQRPGEDCLFVAVDASADTLCEARRHAGNGGRMVFVRADARQLPFRDGSVHGAVCALALHHFSEPDAVMVLRELARVARGPAGVSDLIRGRRHLFGAWLLTTLLMRNPITRHDAVLSVRRAFSAAELRELARRAGWSGARHAVARWFRQCVVWERRDA